MKKTVVFLIVMSFFLGFSSHLMAKNEKLLHAIMMEESGGQAHPKGSNDNGKARGYYQMWEPYFQDACEYGGVYDTKTKKYKEGWDYDTAPFDKEKATQVVTWYMQRYEKRAWNNSNFEILSKLHNGGLNWRKYTKDVNIYWEKIKKRLKK
jgi:hypothetical protein